MKDQESGEGMKLLHLGDLHLGRSLGEFDLIEDQKYILDQVLDIIKDQKVDAVLIAGDVYDKAIPSEGAVNLLDEFIRLFIIFIDTVVSKNHSIFHIRIQDDIYVEVLYE